MKPQLQQSIKLLQLGAQELHAFVEAELERNPLLERDEADEAGGEAGTEIGEAAAPEGPLAIDQALERVEAAGPDSADLDLPPEAVWQAEPEAGDSARWEIGGRSPFDEQSDRPETTAAGGPTLREFLLSQVRVALTEPGDLLIGSRLIDLLDEAGYLPSELEPVAS
jgi:RNA polymerase sigma-54 factor